MIGFDNNDTDYSIVGTEYHSQLGNAWWPQSTTGELVHPAYSLGRLNDNIGLRMPTPEELKAAFFGNDWSVKAVYDLFINYLWSAYPQLAFRLNINRAAFVQAMPMIWEAVSPVVASTGVDSIEGMFDLIIGQMSSVIS